MKTAFVSTILSALARIAMVLSPDTAHAFTSFAGHVMTGVEESK